jgi:phenylacetate-CoA ligase
MITTTKLDPIETASRDELQALQTQRLKWTLKHAYVFSGTGEFFQIV